MKKGSWTLRFQRSDIKRTHGLPQMGQKFLWDVACACYDVSNFGEKKKEAFAHSLFCLCYFQNGGDHVRRLARKAGTRCQRSYLLVDGWEQAI